MKPITSQAGATHPRRFSFAILTAAVLILLAQVATADDWPQWMGPKRDGIWRETGIVEKFPAGGPPLRWRTPIGAGFAGPAVANGRVYVADRLVAPRPAPADAPVGDGKKKKGAPRGVIPGSERVLCLSESDGKIIWKHEYECTYDLAYPSGPRATPVVAAGRVYTLGAAGNLLCLDSQTGSVIWSRDFKKDYGAKTPTWGFSANPLLDGNKLYCMVGGEGSSVVAFDSTTGKEAWKALTASEPGYCPPMIYDAGGKRQLIVWNPAALSSLNPDTGAAYWSEPFTVRMGLTVPTPRLAGGLLFVTAFYDGPLAMRLDPGKPAATVAWRGKGKNERDTDGIHSIICTPFIENGYIYGACSYGQFRCIKADTGERVWESLVPTGGKSDRWANTFIVKQGDRFLLPNEKGDLIIAKLSPAGYEEISRTHLLDPTNHDPGRDVVWSHPAFANRNIYARNDREIVSYSLAANPGK